MYAILELARDTVYVGYLRVSSDKQDETAERQQEQIIQWAERHGILISEWFVDTGSRDKAEQRPNFQRMLKRIENGLIGAVVVQHQDRFGIKDGDEWGFYRHLFRRKYGCKIYSVIDNAELTAADKATAITTQFKANASEEEQIKIANRNLSGMVTAVRQGIKNGSNPPFGYDTGVFAPDGKMLYRLHYVTKKRIVQTFANGSTVELEKAPARDKKKELPRLILSTPDRQKLVGNIFKWFTSEVISMRQIALRLNAKGEMIYGQPWRGHHVTQILLNPAYLGHIVNNRESRGRFQQCVAGLIQSTPPEILYADRSKKPPKRKRDKQDWLITKDAHEPLVDQDTFDEAQERYQNSKRTVRIRFPGYWLRGILVCGHCCKELICKRERGGKKPGPYKKGKNKGKPRQAKQPIPSYACPTYHYALQNGEKPTCRRNTISHDEAEKLVMGYLKNLEIRMESEEDNKLVLSLVQQFSAKEKEWWDVAQEGIKDYCRRIRATFRLTGSSDEGDLFGLVKELQEKYNKKARAKGDEAFDVSDFYESIRIIEEEKIIVASRKRDEARAALRPLTLSWAQAEGYQREILKEECDRLNREAERWDGETVPLLDRLDSIRDELYSILESVKTVNRTLEGESMLKKADAARRVLREVRLFWKPKTSRPREVMLDGTRIEYRPAILEGAHLRALQDSNSLLLLLAVLG
jgi:DNA invertase Pin-like site-specific DNA recombinase